MVAPIVIAGAAVIAKYIIKNGMKMAIKKYGKKAAEEGAELASKSKVLPKSKKLKYRDLNPLGASNKAPQQSIPKRMPKQKTYNKGGKVNKIDYRKTGLFK